MRDCIRNVCASSQISPKTKDEIGWKLSQKLRSSESEKWNENMRINLLHNYANYAADVRWSQRNIQLRGWTRTNNFSLIKTTVLHVYQMKSARTISCAPSRNGDVLVDWSLSPLGVEALLHRTDLSSAWRLESASVILPVCHRHPVGEHCRPGGQLTLRLQVALCTCNGLTYDR